MKRLQSLRRALSPLALAMAIWLGFFLLAPGMTAQAQSGHRLLGGARGVVRSAKAPLEGIMVQLISQKTSIRTTVYSNLEGRYEFPKLDSGLYTLRIAKPLEFHHYVKESVQIDGATQLQEIVLERVTDSEFLPPTPEILPQLTDAEWLYNIPGTGQEKRIFSNSCGTGCHTYQWVFRARYDEHSWRVLVDRMRNHGGRILVRRRDPSALIPQEKLDPIVKWLARVRGPDAKDAPFKVFPRPQGPATRAIVTEYELPHLDARVHDVTGDSQGNIWYTSNRNPILGMLDPRTGLVKEYRVPKTPGTQTGQHWIMVAEDGMVWYSETWTQNLVRFDPRTEEFHVMHTGVQGNMALAPDGYLWRTSRGKIHKFDPETGKSVQEFPMQKARSTYGNFISQDGNFFGGGSRDPSFDGIVFFDIRTGEVKEVESPSGVSAASRGSFDPEGNIWVGGRGGVLVKLDRKTGLTSEYAPPTPYTTFYEAMADKNGEVWAGEMRAGRIARFNPRTHQWIEYVMPEPYAFNWRTWIDNSTDPVTVWYGDHYGYIVRIQPLE